jgi:hypothetical protein
MNEVSNFIPGERSNKEECPPANPPAPLVVKPELDDTRTLPFQVGDVALAYKSISLATQHYSGSDAIFINDQSNIQELYFHPINALGEALFTHEALKSMTG